MIYAANHLGVGPLPGGSQFGHRSLAVAGLPEVARERSETVCLMSIAVVHECLALEVLGDESAAAGLRAELSSHPFIWFPVPAIDGQCSRLILQNTP